MIYVMFHRMINLKIITTCKYPAILGCLIKDEKCLDYLSFFIFIVKKSSRLHLTRYPPLLSKTILEKTLVMVQMTLLFEKYRFEEPHILLFSIIFVFMGSPRIGLHALMFK